MAWGVQTWDAAGKPNNYGLVPVSLLSQISLDTAQVSGSWSFNVPAGYRLDYIHIPKIFAYTTTRRLITVNGSSITLSSAEQSNYGFGSEFAHAAFLVVFLRND
ncbi:hypothetical protein [Erwinia sp. 9145]|uniref:hypothetical protein n=1 Tax=Erwinia sp. 9145 TaxID=1500895 RepID=UPI000558021D|nr:hypothetical protein [Erwinia sp. 9145]